MSDPNLAVEFTRIRGSASRRLAGVCHLYRSRAVVPVSGVVSDVLAAHSRISISTTVWRHVDSYGSESTRISFLRPDCKHARATLGRSSGACTPPAKGEAARR